MAESYEDGIGILLRLKGFKVEKVTEEETGLSAMVNLAVRPTYRRYNDGLCIYLASFISYPLGSSLVNLIKK